MWGSVPMHPLGRGGHGGVAGWSGYRSMWTLRGYDCESNFSVRWLSLDGTLKVVRFRG